MNLDVFKGFDYEPQDDDETIMLSELPLNLITDSIREQFNDPSNYAKNDFVQVFETRYNVTKEQMDEDNEDEINTLYIRFVSFMRDIFKEKLSIGLPSLEDMTEHDQLQLIHYVYRFFITNMKKNFVTYVCNYIEKYKTEIAENLPKKKDVTWKSLKDIVTDVDDLTILTSISAVLPRVLEDDSILVDEFLELADDKKDGNLENEYIKDKYEDFNITGNFIPFYYKLLDPSTRIEIECKVRNCILSKYRKDAPVNKVTPKEEVEEPVAEPTENVDINDEVETSEN